MATLIFNLVLKHAFNNTGSVRTGPSFKESAVRIRIPEKSGFQMVDFSWNQVFLRYLDVRFSDPHYGPLLKLPSVE